LLTVAERVAATV